MRKCIIVTLSKYVTKYKNMRKCIIVTLSKYVTKYKACENAWSNSQEIFRIEKFLESEQ